MPFPQNQRSFTRIFHFSEVGAVGRVVKKETQTFQLSKGRTRHVG